MADLGIDGVRVGNWTDVDARTGCTVIIFDQPTFASGEVRGGAPATREFALLDPRRTVHRLDALVMSGGSAFGLAACDGVVAQCEAEGRGFETDHGIVPIVVGMSLFDLAVGRADVRPDAAAGARAWDDAGMSFEIGPVGAGTGATVGNWRGPANVRSSGLGAATVRSGGLVVSALVAVNAAGDPTAAAGRTTSAEISAGAFEWPGGPPGLGENTTIGMLVTNAQLSKIECRLLAEGGHDGLARGIVPAHTPMDGDALVAVSRPEIEAPVGQVRLMGAVAVERAIESAAVTIGSVDR